MEDVVIIGSGIAGYSAAMCLNHFSCNYKLITGVRNNIGGQLNMAPKIDNYPGICSGISGIELMDYIKKQVDINSSFIYDEVVSVDFSSVGSYIVKTKDVNLLSKSVIICTGKTCNKLNIENEDFYIGKGVSYCAVCDGFLYKNKNVCVVGGGDSAIRSVIYLSSVAKSVYLLVRSDKLRACSKLIESLNDCRNVVIHYRSTIKKLRGTDYVESIEIFNDGGIIRLDVDCVFVNIGSSPNTYIFEKFLNLDSEGYIITNSKNETNISGVFAAGDVQSNTYKQAIIAAGNGYNAAMNAYYYVKSL